MSLHYPGQGRGNGKARLTPEAERLLETSIAEDYLVKSRPSMLSAYNRCEQRFRAENRECELPSYKTYCRRIGQLDEVTVAEHRIGKRAARHIARNQTGSTATTHILERVELDATKLPLLVVNDDVSEIIGRPTIFLIKDRHSGAVVGYHYTFGGESAVAVIETLRLAILPKAEFHDRHPHVRNRWRMHGLPLQLVMDAGPGMQSIDLDEMCLNLGINVVTNPTAQPWRKGAVESIMGELDQICAELPGGVHKELGSLPSDYDAVKNACISISRFEAILAQAIVDVINQRASEHDGLSPDERWQLGREAAPPHQPAHVPELFAYGTKRIYRPIHRHKGVTFQRGWWNSDQLQQLREKLGPKQKVEIRINPNGIDTVYVVNPETHQFIEVPLVTPEYTGLTLDELHTLRRVVRKRYNRHKSHEALRLAREDIDRTVAASRAEARSRSRRRARRTDNAPAFPLDPDQQGGISDDGVLRDALKQQAGFLSPVTHLISVPPKKEDPPRNAGSTDNGDTHDDPFGDLSDDEGFDVEDHG